eukprot:3431696-Amphidinium_carterae.1
MSSTEYRPAEQWQSVAWQAACVTPCMLHFQARAPEHMRTSENCSAGSQTLLADKCDLEEICVTNAQPLGYFCCVRGVKLRLG